ncbi:tetratricopeptide repeat protein [Gammaproteobacteria bacterium AB-CW1]|uniref:Tetratricopeptide repeat protein n=1 Tax=Natronospira elongata TaxID=3110268 RepID=A0AAP6JEG3_9GAMM|nr:tetratricopeptide repeat protein [Gammaproteobacteria bacterium AB-CW1]
MLENLLKMLERGQDSAMLRFSLGNEYLRRDALPEAAQHYQAALELDAQYSAAWRAYGRTLLRLERLEAAVEALEQGIPVAEARGDKQAAREMQVFLKRARKQLSERDRDKS